MRKYFMIGFGGFLGSICRYLIKGINPHAPVYTLIINITGTFLLALILALFAEAVKMDPDIRLGITTGFLGAFTTFSTLCADAVKLLETGDYFSAVLYLSGSALLGIGAALLGTVIAQKCLLKIAFQKKEEAE